MNNPDTTTHEEDNEDETNYKEIHLSDRQWASMPASASPWESRAVEREQQLQTGEAIALAFQRFMWDVLTERQWRVMELYYFANMTQEEIAEELQISQPTVSQHLYGKVRNGRRVGGAHRRMRKAVGRIAAASTPNRPYQRIVALLGRLLECKPSRRRFSQIMGKLAEEDFSLQDQ